MRKLAASRILSAIIGHRPGHRRLDLFEDKKRLPTPFSSLFFEIVFQLNYP
jgi:hypothetical protein